MDPILENEGQSITSESSERRSKRIKKKNVPKTVAGNSQTVVGERRKFVVTKLPPDLVIEEDATATNRRINAHTIHFGTHGPEKQRPSVQTIFQHPKVSRDAESVVTRPKDDSYVYSQTVHGTSSTQRASLFDVFKLKKKPSDVKKPSLMKQVKAVLYKIPHRDEESSSNSQEIPQGNVNVDKAGNNKHYYHTVTGASSRRPSTITRVMDIFRSKPSELSPNSPRSKSNKASSSQGSGPPRRSSLDTSTFTHSKLSYAHLDPNKASQLFREIRGLPKYDPYISLVNITRGRDRSKLVIDFFKYHRCYELLPKSAKVIIFDTQFLVKKAFTILINNGIRSAPLWDSDLKTLVGMITVTDFIKILLFYYKNNMSMHDLEEHTFHTWRSLLHDIARPLVYVSPDASLFEAINVLIKSNVHRIPIIDVRSGDVLYILSHKRVLRFLFIYLSEFPDITFIRSKLRDLNIGTYSNLETVSEDTTLLEAFQKFIDKDISVLPLIDDQGRLKSVFAKYDVLNIVSDKCYNNLNVTLREVCDRRKEWEENIQKCNVNISLYAALENIVTTESHRLFLIDDSEKLVGIIALSDLLSYLTTSVSEDRPSALHIFDEKEKTAITNDVDNELPDESAIRESDGETSVGDVPMLEDKCEEIVEMDLDEKNEMDHDETVHLTVLNEESDVTASNVA